MKIQDNDAAVRVASGVVPPRLALPFVEFVALIASMMALTALSIDIMLPALPQIGEALGVTSENERQNVIIVYVLGFAAGQIVYGPLSDRWGRKPVLLTGFGLFIAGSLAALVAPTFETLLLARALQGIGAASPRVMSIAIVRDLFTGRQMARVMSLAMMVFIVIPVLAPALGQLMMTAGNWRTPLDALLVFGVLAAAWTAWRLPETRVTVPGNLAEVSLWDSAKAVLSVPQTVGYMLGSGFMFGCLMGYIASSQQVFVDIFDLGPLFPVVFGAIASVMAVASFANAQLVGNLGMRFVSHTALCGSTASALVLVATTLAGALPLWLFCVLVAICFFCFGLVAPNFNALAMEPQGKQAGMASSIIGFYSTGAGAIIGGLVGHMFDGTVLPLAFGFLACSALAGLAVFAVEGREGLFGRNRPNIAVA
jgi:DHA1 family bicyclomycin/chloramphenicol resistance-like MFS transporter